MASRAGRADARPVTMASQSLHEPDRRPPRGAVRLASEQRERADGGDEQRGLHEQRNAQEPAAGHQIEQHALQGQQS